MGRWLICTLALVASLSSPGLAQPVLRPPQSVDDGEIRQTPVAPSLETLRTLAQEMTVKVVLENNWGSGILIQQQGTTYTVLTNRHVLNAGTQYQVQTADGTMHAATPIVAPATLDTVDLGLLQFSSPHPYPIATFSDRLPVVGDRLYAAGYPVEDDPSQPVGFTCLAGSVTMLSDQSFNGGYQIGSDLAIAKGMSGGPLLNEWGQVIGINGMHQYPLWGNPYIYLDGSSPSMALRDEMSGYSWSIPIHTVWQGSLPSPTPTPSATPPSHIPQTVPGDRPLTTSPSPAPTPELDL